MTDDDKTRALAEVERYAIPYRTKPSSDGRAHYVVDARGMYLCGCSSTEVAEEIARALNERWGRLGL